MGLIVTACSSRKRRAPAPGLRASELPLGSIDHVSTAWVDRVRRCGAVARASDLYCGRSFQEAQAAARLCRGRLVVVSAGLGLIEAEAEIPSYSLTVSPRSGDNVLDRVEDRGSAGSWWARVKAAGPLTVADLVSSDGLILVALPRTYLDMTADDLGDLLKRAPGRVRIFTRSGPDAVDPRLSPAVMPYDGRLDGPQSSSPGTLADFAQRAARHFVETVLRDAPDEPLDAHRDRVFQALADWDPPAVAMRPRRSDDEIRDLIRRHWGAGDGRSSRMLRVLRDKVGVACEQARFAALFAEVTAERSSARG